MWRRRVFNLLALLSLLICATLLVLGVPNRDQFVFTAGGRLYWVMVGGSVEVLTVGGWPQAERTRWITAGPGRDEPMVSIEGRPSVRQWLGVEFESTPVATKLDEQGRPAPIGRVDARPAGLRTSPMMRLARVGVPTWMAVLATAALPAAAAVRGAARLVARRRQARLGLCRACGYDLRGNVSGVCPECGAGAPAGGVA